MNIMGIRAIKELMNMRINIHLSKNGAELLGYNVTAIPLQQVSRIRV